MAKPPCLNFRIITATDSGVQIFWNFTVMILSFRTDMPGQTVQTQIRLLLEEQSDQGLHCLPFHLHHLDSMVEPHNSNFRVNRTKFLGVRIFRKFTVRYGNLH